MILYLPKWLWASFISLLVFYSLNLTFKTDFLYIAQAIMTIASIYLFGRRRLFQLAFGLSLIMVADINYYILLYKLQLDSNNLYFYLSTSLLYSLGFIIITIAIYRHVGKSLKLFMTYKVSLIPVLILIGASISFMLYPLYTLILKGQINYNSIATIVEMSTSIPLIIIAYLAIILSFDLSDASLALGILLIGLVDWGIQFEYVTIGTLAFSYYDFFWFFGLLLIFSRAVDSRDFHTFTTLKTKSLRIQLKILILIASLLPVGTYYILSQGDQRLSISFFLIGSALSLLVASIVVEFFSAQLSLLTKEIEQIFKATSIDSNSLSQNQLSDEWEESLKLILKNKLQQEKIDALNEKLLLQKKAELSAQVSHDIRSPLAALNMVLSSIGSIPEEKRILARNAVNRINDIANTLLIKNVKPESSLESTNSQTEILLLSPIIDSLISEKRVQYREKQGIEIELETNQAYGLFIDINPRELKRVVSNLINNSIEALPNASGKITVSVINENELAILTVKDTGIGIPKDILKKLGEIGVSYNKQGTQSGSGLGIYHAMNTIKEAGGNFQIDSLVNKGTLIKISFKKAKAPKWFVEKILLTPNMQITCLDDDKSIHQIWRNRLENKNYSTFNIDYKSFTSGSEFKNWILSKTADQESEKFEQLYLIDFELLNQKYTGLDYIEELQICSKSILVTSHFEERQIRERCEKLGIKLIPKAMAELVPIENRIITKEKPS